jgi:RNase P subunit RPR2
MSIEQQEKLREHHTKWGSSRHCLKNNTLSLARLFPSARVSLTHIMQQSYRAQQLRRLRCINCGGPRVHHVEWHVRFAQSYTSNLCLVCDCLLSPLQKQYVHDQIRFVGWQMPGLPELHTCGLDTTERTASICLRPHCYSYLPHPDVDEDTQRRSHERHLRYTEEREAECPSVDSLRVHALMMPHDQTPHRLLRRFQPVRPDDRHRWMC